MNQNILFGQSSSDLLSSPINLNNITRCEQAGQIFTDRIHLIILPPDIG
ncbi:MAG: hypothetical protein HZB59_03090 [Ignavibacteriales bacterium]|nr:hypothetical protein [Ignavibacteriales bacterium]